MEVSLTWNQLGFNHSSESLAPQFLTLGLIRLGLANDAVALPVLGWGVKDNLCRDSFLGNCIESC
jgi:hypothetical protein